MAGTVTEHARGLDVPIAKRDDEDLPCSRRAGVFSRAVLRVGFLELALHFHFNIL